MKNTTGKFNLDKKKDQLRMKLILTHILTDPKNHLTRVDIENEIYSHEAVDYNKESIDGWMKHYLTGNQTLTIYINRESTTPETKS